MTIRPSILILTVMLLLATSCANKDKPLVKTSLGDLVRIEKKASVQTSDANIDAKPDEILYLLSFEGKKEIAYEGKTGAEGPTTLQLVDSKGTSYAPVFAGSPGDDGVISNKDWKYNGSMTGRDGKFVFTGTLDLPAPKISLVYSVSKNASGLKVKDGNQTHEIE